MKVVGFEERGLILRYPGLTDDDGPEHPETAYTYWGLVVVECGSKDARDRVMLTCRVVENLDDWRLVVQPPAPEGLSYPLVGERGVMPCIASCSEEKEPPKGHWHHFVDGRHTMPVHRDLDDVMASLCDVRCYLVIGLDPFTVIEYMPKDRVGEWFKGTRDPMGVTKAMPPKAREEWLARLKHEQ